MSTLYTIGHGNRTIDEFVGMLAEAGTATLADVRAYPASRRHPQFSRPALEQALAAAGIGYLWEGQALGGRRKPVAGSPHTAQRHPSFRAYADHMSSEAFVQRIGALVALSPAAPVSLMCAERLPWQCHRYLISDYLVAAGATVIHLINPAKRREHRLHPVARVTEGGLVYDREPQGSLEL